MTVTNRRARAFKPGRWLVKTEAPRSTSSARRGAFWWRALSRVGRQTGNS
ncbi:hypothetical protein AB0F88_33105 [Streptosporangium sp. NPDC023963]